MRIAEVYAVDICGSLTSMPSSVTLCWSARAPATDPYRGSTVAGLLVGMKIAPGCRLSRCTTFCASTGRLRICSRDITLPTLASVVLRCVVSETTLTVSETPPTSRTTVSRDTESTCRTTLSTIFVLKPASSTFSEYRPGCTLLSRKLPRSSVVVTFEAAVATCVAVTVAPGITCFCASVTSPTSAAVPVCASAAGAANNGNTTTAIARVHACSRSERNLVKASSKEKRFLQFVPHKGRSRTKNRDQSLRGAGLKMALSASHVKRMVEMDRLRRSNGGDGRSGGAATYVPLGR